MVFGMSKAGAKPDRRRDRFRALCCAELEDRVLLTVIDLANTTTAPYGVQLTGADPGGGAGWKVTDVGDINGDGFDSFLVTEPTVTPTNNQPVLGGGSGKAYLVFGSKDVNAGTVNWAALNVNQRLGNLSSLGNVNQSNPLTGAAGFNFAGVTFITSQGSSARLGASVAALGDINGDGFTDFLIGAPGALDTAGLNAGTGRAYLVYGGPALNGVVTQVDLDNPTASGVNVVTFESSLLTGANIGSAVSNVGDFFGNNRNDIVIGARNASINGGNSGAVFVINGSALATPTTSIALLDQVGQVGGIPGVIFTGAASGDGVGSSLAAAGSFDGAKNTAGGFIGDLLIGAPNGGTPSADLVYGGTSILTKPTSTLGTLNINLARLGDPAQTGTDVAGVVFQGTSSGDLTGFAVNTAGDFNNDGLNDIMIGSPDANSGSGRVDLIYGQPASSPAGHIVGTFQLGNLPATINSVSFLGSSGSLAGFSLAPLGAINANPVNNLLIGAPGFNANSGEVIVIPGNPNLSGSFPLDQGAIQAVPVQATVIVDSTPVPTGTGPYFLGASLSANLVPNGSGTTIDADRLADFIIGAPGLSLTSGQNYGGSAFVIEGRFFPLTIPVATGITTTIGINQANPPFTLNVSTSTTLKIFVFSNGTINPTFNPVTDINPATIVVNGVPFPTATIAADPVDENGDGIPDAIITISPVSALNLQNGVQTITLTGRTLATASNSNKVFTGAAQVTVTGATTGGGTGTLPPVAAVSPTFGFPISGAAAPLYGGSLVPSLTDLSPYPWTPLTIKRAYQQFLPDLPFRLRHQQIYHKFTQLTRFAAINGHNGYKSNTLSQGVFSRVKLKHGFAPPKVKPNLLPHNGLIA